jgi:hypothetical protein
MLAGNLAEVGVDVGTPRAALILEMLVGALSAGAGNGDVSFLLSPARTSSISR